MCGIVGLIDSSRSSDSIRKALGAMCRTLIHRGPDDEGIVAVDGAGIGMRRLSIIDVAGGHQPLSNEDGSLALIFNGEIYNHELVRKELLDLGHVMKTRSDGEVILHGYEAWGERVCQKIDGMFALAILDLRSRRLFLARDRFGKKPLYLARLAKGGLAFASEIKALLALPEIRRVPNQKAIYHYLTLQYVPDPMSAFEGIEKLPAAHFLTWEKEDEENRPRRYWRLAYEPKEKMSEDDAAAMIREEAERATKARLMSEVPLGAFLSGGIDSTVVVALMAQHSSAPVKTFSIGFNERAFSELPQARAVADTYSTDHHEFVVKPDAAEVLSKMVRAFDEPFADPSALPVWYLSELTRKHVTVALNGDGGDEMFAGYQRYQLDRWANAWTAIPEVLRRPMEKLFGNMRESADVPIERNWRAGLRRLGQVASADRRASIVRWGSYFSEEMKRRICAQDFLHRVGNSNSESWIASYFDSALAANFLEQTLSADIETYLAGDLLVKVDRMTMAHSLEGRSPFLDYRLAEKVARLPASMKLRKGKLKYIMKRAFAELIPEALRNRPKQGFGIPLGAWMRTGPLAERTRDALVSLGRRGYFKTDELGWLQSEHASGRVDHGKRLWALLVLEEWFRIYFD